MMKTALLCTLLVLLSAGCNVSAETEQAASISAASAAIPGTGQPENGRMGWAGLNCVSGCRLNDDYLSASRRRSISFLGCLLINARGSLKTF